MRVPASGASLLPGKRDLCLNEFFIYPRELRTVRERWPRRGPLPAIKLYGERSPWTSSSLPRTLNQTVLYETLRTAGHTENYK